jgi:hypothetical protein
MLNKPSVRISLSLLISVISSFVFIPAANATACSPTTTTYGSYTVLSFTTTGTCTWTAPSDISTADILLIGGGGGGGGAAFAGGGGAGGFVEKLNHSITSGSTYSIVVGIGGAGGDAPILSDSDDGDNGGDTSFDSLIAKGGGGGAGYSNGVAGNWGAVGFNGGSGGGSSENKAVSSSSTQSSYSGATTKGNAGGYSPDLSFSSGTKAGGGGGGAGSAGANATTNNGGAGGSGFASSIRTGSAITYAAGGNGGSNATNTAGTSASSNTGNGGSAGNWSSGSGVTGGNGGSGLFVIRYIANSTPTNTADPQIWLGKYSIECPNPNPGKNETIKTANKVTPVDANFENLVGRNISQQTLDLMGEKEIYFDFWSKKIKTATIELPPYGCSDKLVKINKNNSIQFIAGGFNLQSEARGYLQTPEGKWFDLTGVTLYKDTAAFLHTIKFVQPGTYVIVLSEQPNTDAGLLPTYGYKNARFVLNVSEKSKAKKSITAKVSSRSTQESVEPRDFKALSQRSVWTNETTNSNYSYLLIACGLMIFFFYRRRNLSFNTIEAINVDNKFTNYVENLYEQIVSKN